MANQGVKTVVVPIAVVQQPGVDIVHVGTPEALWAKGFR